jgi:hypothetical protein
MSVQARQARRLNRPDAGSPYSYGYCVFSGWVARGRRGSGCSLSMTLLGCRVGSILRMWEVDRSRDGTGHVFISYVREDQQRVSRLEGQFRSAGIRLWRDSTDLRPGQDWAIEIRRAIERGLAFIACFSEHTERRSASFQNKELIWAVEEVRGHQPGRVWLLPVRFAECKLPTFDLGGGRSLDALHRVDLFEDSTWDSGAKRLVESVRCVQGESKVQAAPPPFQSAPLVGFDLADLFSGQARNGDIQADVTISVAEMAYGATVSIRVRAEERCTVCGGDGIARDTPQLLCTDCNGTGKSSTFGTSQCRECRGRGRVGAPCSYCVGDGYARRTVRIRIPAGVKNGQRLRVTGKGAPGRLGRRGDLYVRVHVKR